MSTPLSEQIETPRASRVITVLKAVRRAPATVLIFCIELYRTYVSPLRMPTCRFTPPAVNTQSKRCALTGRSKAFS